MSARLKPRQQLGKYRIVRRLADGGFASVYQAFDTIEGIGVALKVPFAHLLTPEALKDFRREVRITAQLDHPNILPIKNADFIDGIFVIVYPLGERSLADRLQYRISLRQALSYAEQALQALAYAHRRRIIHCDVKPENLILFDADRLRLSDFGIAKMALHTVTASGSGTVGYVAPEQAMGRPSFRSDCFSLGLIIYRMLSGQLPRWPYAWPPPGYDSLRGKIQRDLLDFVRRAIEVDEHKRFANAVQMLAAFRRVKPKALAHATRRRRRKAKPTARTRRDWEQARQREFRRHYGKALQLRFSCTRCNGPVSEAMQACPWCGTSRTQHKDATRFPKRCKHCKRGMKLDWRFCPWCYSGVQGPDSEREYTDVRYVARCSNPKCTRRDLMPFMRYCPWCHRKVRRRWPVAGSTHRCANCGWGVVPDYWRSCPWCGQEIRKR